MQSRRYQAPPPNPTLSELLAKTGDLDRILDGRGLEFERTSEPPAPPPLAPLEIPPYDSSSFVDPPEPKPELEPADKPEPYPAKPGKAKQPAKTPRLNKVRAWLEEDRR
jgi:hypothetical protein